MIRGNVCEERARRICGNLFLFFYFMTNKFPIFFRLADDDTIRKIRQNSPFPSFLFLVWKGILSDYFSSSCHPISFQLVVVFYFFLSAFLLSFFTTNISRQEVLKTDDRKGNGPTDILTQTMNSQLCFFFPCSYDTRAVTSCL